MMNCILLSGGSGKRLWPLSNDIRSKQFIKILKKDDNSYESMVQRVYRQIKCADNDANILIATSKSQVPVLKNQLGDKIDISIEPCRRDTFPAIALASMYLKDVRNVDINDIVVVSPVDPYADDSFFSILKKLSDKMKNSTNSIGLIGIKPTYSSEKYGYILVKKDNIVDSFIEKPKEELARKLINEGALWNSGVFCFKLKYIIDKAHELIEFEDYYDLYNMYEKLSKISFDYAVVEKEKQIEVIKYDGEWKDIGTWNTLSEVMTDQSIGNVIIDNKSFNTNIINELNIPLIAMGLNNVIVAANYDGIFVSEKKESSYNKPLVERLSNRPMFEERSWGNYTIIENKLETTSNYLVKHIYIYKGKSISYQKHKYRKEIWTIVSGEGIFLLNDNRKSIKTGDVLIIDIEQKHSIYATSDLHFIEVQIGEELKEEDIIHYEYDWRII